MVREGRRARFVKALLFSARATGEWGRLDTQGYSILWALNRIEELASLACIARARFQEGVGMPRGEQGIFEKAKQVQWERLVRKCTSPNCPIARIEDGKEEWKTWVGQLKATANRPWEAAELLKSTADWAAMKLEKRKKEHQEARKKGWWKWVKEQKMAGGGALHKYVKRKEEQLDEVLTVEGMFTASAQSIVDKETDEWRSIWGRGGNVGRAPWRGSEMCEKGEAVPRLTVKQLRKAALSFKSRTGCGTDA